MDHGIHNFCYANNVKFMSNRTICGANFNGTPVWSEAKMIIRKSTPGSASPSSRDFFSHISLSSWQWSFFNCWLWTRHAGQTPNIAVRFWQWKISPLGHSRPLLQYIIPTKNGKEFFDNSSNDAFSAPLFQVVIPLYAKIHWSDGC